MANANFVAYNDQGIEQVSLNGYNLCLLNKGSVAASGFTINSGLNGMGGGIKVISGISAKSPVLALSTNVAGQNGSVYGMLTKTGTDTWSLSLLCGAWPYTASVDWYIFDYAPPTAGTFGLCLYDGAGKIIFSTATPCLRIVDVIDWNYYTVVGNPTSKAVPGGKKYAQVSRNGAGSLIVGSYNSGTGDTNLNNVIQGVAGGNGVTCTCGWECFWRVQPAPHGITGSLGSKLSSYGKALPGSSQPTSNVYSDSMVVDVTGY